MCFGGDDVREGTTHAENTAQAGRRGGKHGSVRHFPAGEAGHVTWPHLKGGACVTHPEPTAQVTKQECSRCAHGREERDS